MRPLAVAVPGDADDVSALVHWAHDTCTPLVPRGSGSSMAGGAVGRGVIIDLSRLRHFGVVDERARSLRVGPGVLRAEVDRLARSHGLRFPVDPSSGAFCTVGGMASTNAAGSHSLRFGPMRSWVRALDCVFDDGTRAEIRRSDVLPANVPALARFLREGAPALASEASAPAVHAGVRKEASGYATAAYGRGGDLVDLLVGSEGTLALFVGLELALAPEAEATSSVLGAFPVLDDAVDAAVRARDAGATACELLDRTFLEVARSGGRVLPVPEETEAVLLAEVENEDGVSAADRAHALERLFRANGAAVRVALDAATEAELWELRHAASPILAHLDPSLKSMQFIEDAAVPPARLADYVRGVRVILARHGLRGVIFGHAGDAHVHVNPLIDVRQSDWRDRMERVLDEVTALVATLGGTLSGEHGDGRLRTPLLPRVWSAAARAQFSLVKDCFDPRRILNPGVKVPLRHERAIESVKYDPALQPPPESAREALATVERERAYARFRLDLLAAAARSG
ncbi:MAG TPA: FAD-binding oxidoreductase [Gemmatimonadaceae bacterium]|nr:FAD-binding oxidoreductase [Gemmatimonadaceae bacterium]